MKSTLLSLFLFSVVCYNSDSGNVTDVSVRMPGRKFEGYVYLTIQTFTDVDHLGNPINPLKGDDAMILSSSRKMYLYDDLLLDIEDSKHFLNWKYMKTDTSEYSFYDLKTQLYAVFDTLSAEAKMLRRGLMEVSGSFSNANAFDPVKKELIPVLQFVDTVFDDRRLILARPIGSDTTTDAFIKRIRFYIDPEITAFPVQLSYTLSEHSKKFFACKTQLPMPDGKTVMVSELRYEPARLDTNLIRTFMQWQKRVNDK